MERDFRSREDVRRDDLIPFGLTGLDAQTTTPDAAMLEARPWSEQRYQKLEIERYGGLSRLKGTLAFCRTRGDSICILPAERVTRRG